MAKKPRTGAGETSRILGVFQANKGMIANILRRYSIRQLDISDFTQETILRALEAEKRVHIKEPRRFLVGIAKNIARAELERRSKMTLELLDDFDPQSYVSDEPAVDDIVSARAEMRLFWEAVQTLPPQCQKVFVMKHVYGASHKEIARKLDIAVSTVEKHVALGLRRCRERMLSGEAEETDPGEAARVRETKKA
ncbi:MAG: sigma-70 family RNA polymerase sigma factor [Pseudomonadota bacterium]|nr:sigma-70 family RNA polymerase sigma factor [Pseudomonadota bacterium]